MACSGRCCYTFFNEQPCSKLRGIEHPSLNSFRGKPRGIEPEEIEVALGVTSRTAAQASPAQLLRINRGHWAIENSCHYVLDQTWDEDRCRMALGHPLLSGYGPENTSRLRRFAISLLNLHAKPNESIASMTRKLAAKTRLVFDYLLMTKNSTRHAAAA